ncbi:MAG: class II fumarate hydratase [Pseudomonadota bacterium]
MIRDGARVRLEQDSLGTVEVPEHAEYGPQTQRAVENFSFSGRRLPKAFLRSLLSVKGAAATVNGELGFVEPGIAVAIASAAEALQHERDLTDHFPVDVFQTGSGTSTNMNANEVLARRAAAIAGVDVHPNDHVNFGQSSNDVIPTAIHVSAAVCVAEDLVPAVHRLIETLRRRAEELCGVVKTGRTHLMDAMPVRFDQSLGSWAAQLEHALKGIEFGAGALRSVALGGTAVGTGVNTDPRFATRVCAVLSKELGVAFTANPNPFSLMASQDPAVALSGQLKTLAVALMKISNDLRWMNSGPTAGLGEIELEALQPGSSIMPGKVNPVIPEAVCMIAAEAIGNDSTITVAGQSGNFELNVMLPVIAYNLLESIRLLANGCTALAGRGGVGTFEVKTERVTALLDRNPILVTALNPIIGYAAAARIAKQAFAEQRPLLEVALEQTDLTDVELRRLLDAGPLTRGGLSST